MKKTLILFLTAALLFALCLTGCGQKDAEPSADSVYADPSLWAYYETETEGTVADVFFICPVVYLGEDGDYQWTEYDEATKAAFIGATNMEKGIYEERTRFFAPFYHQASLAAYTLPSEERETYLASAYEDVKEAFAYYLEHDNNGRPIIIAGFSQGADLSYRLLKDFFAGTPLAEQLVACYAPGWYLTEEQLRDMTGLAAASGETDTGVIITFSTEDESITASLVLPSDCRTCSINPLNWMTDSTPADKSLNKGACFTDYSGSIVSEIPNLTGAYLDDTRGALKVPDIVMADYPSVLPVFPEGVYHLYDYQFFYRNLQENVQVRLDSFLAQHS